MNFQRGGWLADAEIIYADILKVEPDHFDSTHNLGVIRYHQGRLAEALPLLEHAIKLDPNSADALSNYGVVLRALGRWPEALDAFDRAIKLRPDYPEAHSNRGGVLIDLGRTEEALEAYNRAMIARRGFVDALLGRGIALTRLKRFSDALVAFGRVIGIDPNHAEALIQRAYPLIELRRYEEAVATCDRAIAINPRNPVPHHQRGIALSELGRPADAAASFQRAIAIWPEFVEALFCLSIELQRLGRFDEALAAIDRCLTLDPGQLSAAGTIAAIFCWQWDGTRMPWSPMIALWLSNPIMARLITTRAMLFVELARIPEASECFQKAVALNSVHPDIALNEGLARLLAGDLRHGFKRYEGRFQKTEHAPQIRKFKQPRWTGFDIAGKRILLHDEQGLGDAIHFARYVPLVAQRGAEVILQVQASLKILLASVKGVSQVYERGARLPEFDVHQYLLSLAEVFETELDSVPAEVPYIAAPADRIEKWRKRLPAKHGLRVGLVWSGNPAFAGDASRSIGLCATGLRCFPCQACNSSVCIAKCRAEDAPIPAKVPRARPFWRRAHRLRRHGCHSHRS